MRRSNQNHFRQQVNKGAEAKIFCQKPQRTKRRNKKKVHRVAQQIVKEKDTDVNTTEEY